MDPTYQPPRPTDAQIAANAAAEALREGRYALGAAFARIAEQAHRMEVAEHQDDRIRNVPMAGPTRDEQPRTPTFDDLKHEATELLHAVTDQAIDHAAELAQRSEEAQAAVFGQPVSPAMHVPLSGRCRAMLGTPAPDGSTSIGECHRVVWWHDGGPTTEGPNLPPGWYHVEPEVDQHHPAVVPARMGRD